jgi:hypothetical protein
MSAPFMGGIIITADYFINFVFVDSDLASPAFYTLLVIDFLMVTLRESDSFDDVYLWVINATGVNRFASCIIITLKSLHMLLFGGEDVSLDVKHDVQSVIHTGSITPGGSGESVGVSLREGENPREHPSFWYERVRKEVVFSAQLSSICTVSEVISNTVRQGTRE